MNTLKTIVKVIVGVMGFMFLILITIGGIALLPALMIISLITLFILALIGIPAIIIGGIIGLGKLETDYRAEVIAKGIERAEQRKK